jgi:quercetin dioxygenase-like cupin family protein
MGIQIENPVTRQRLTFLEASDEVFRMSGVFSPGGFAGPLHVHPLQAERFEVLRGTGGFQVNGRRLTLLAPQALDVPAGTPHTFWNAGDDDFEGVMEFRPGLPASTRRFYEAYFGLSIAGRTNAAGMPNLWQVAVEMPRMQAHVRLARPPWPVQRLALGAIRPFATLLGYRPFNVDEARTPGVTRAAGR